MRGEEKNVWWVKTKRNRTERNRTEQDRTGPNRTGAGGRGPSLPVYGLREVVPGTGNRMQTKNVTHNAEVS